MAVDQIDLSLDDIIKMNKKMKNKRGAGSSNRGSGRGGARRPSGTLRSSAGTGRQSSVQNFSRGGKRGRGRGSGTPRSNSNLGRWPNKQNSPRGGKRGRGGFSRGRGAVMNNRGNGRVGANQTPRSRRIRGVLSANKNHPGQQSQGILKNEFLSSSITPRNRRKAQVMKAKMSVKKAQLLQASRLKQNQARIKQNQIRAQKNRQMIERRTSEPGQGQQKRQRQQTRQRQQQARQNQVNLNRQLHSPPLQQTGQKTRRWSNKSITQPAHGIMQINVDNTKKSDNSVQIQMPRTRNKPKAPKLAPYQHYLANNAQPQSSHSTITIQPNTEVKAKAPISINRTSFSQFQTSLSLNERFSTGPKNKGAANPKNRTVFM